MLPLNPEWILDRLSRTEILRSFEFEPTTLALFDEAANRINTSPGLRSSFAQEAGEFFDHRLTQSAFPSDWGWCALVVACGFRNMQEEHRMRGVPVNFTASTARDLARWVKSFAEGTNVLGKFPLSWFRNHLHRGLIEIGRLQFVPAKFSANCRVYTKRGGETGIVALASGGISCSPDGWLGGGGFETGFRESRSDVVAHPVDLTNGQIKSTPVTLNLAEWDLRLEKGDPILDVHIPAGDPLRASLCTQSFDQAELLFGSTTPGLAWRAFSCTSWMLDREVHGCLPRTSGIVAFGERFQALPAAESDSNQFLERVLQKVGEPGTFENRTSLQRAAQDHLSRGGFFRTTSGFILRKDRPLEAVATFLPPLSQLQAS